MVLHSSVAYRGVRVSPRPLKAPCMQMIPFFEACKPSTSVFCFDAQNAACSHLRPQSMLLKCTPDKRDQCGTWGLTCKCISAHAGAPADRAERGRDLGDEQHDKTWATQRLDAEVGQGTCMQWGGARYAPGRQRRPTQSQQYSRLQRQAKSPLPSLMHLHASNVCWELNGSKGRRKHQVCLA